MEPESGGISKAAIFSSVEPIVLFGASTSLALGYFSVYQLIFQKRFVSGYKALRDAFDFIVYDKINEFVGELSKKADPESTPSELIDLVSKWSARLSAIKEVGDRYDKLVSKVKLALVLLGISSLVSLFGVSYPGVVGYTSPANPNSNGSVSQGPFAWADVSLVFLGFGLVVVFWYVFDYMSISGKIARFEAGEPIEKVFESEIKDAERESEHVQQ